MKIDQVRYKPADTTSNGLLPIEMEADLSGSYASLARFINAIERDEMFFVINAKNAKLLTRSTAGDSRTALNDHLSGLDMENIDQERLYVDFGFEITPNPLYDAGEYTLVWKKSKLKVRGSWLYSVELLKPYLTTFHYLITGVASEVYSSWKPL